MRKLLTTATLTSYRPLNDKSFNISLNIPEPSQLQRDVLHSLHQQAVFVLIKEGEIENDEVAQFETLEPELFKKKSQSKRMYNVFFILWKQDNWGFTEFKDFYTNRMELLITQLKNKIV